MSTPTLFQRGALVAIALLMPILTLPAQESRQATGVKVGEVSDTTARVWVRLTENATRNTEGQPCKGRKPVVVLPPETKIETLENACPGAPGQVRVRYATNRDLRDAIETPWTAVTAATDFAHQFALQSLAPKTTYYYATETRAPDGTAHAPLRGSFHTAPRPTGETDVTFTVVTGMMYNDVDNPDGFDSFATMTAMRPDFIIPTGDTVYYDNENPRATTVPAARYHWDRMYGFPRHIAFHLATPGYWLKDDHDTYTNDCWPTMVDKKMNPLTFADGLEIWRQQVPIGRPSYRTYRWGKGLQIWLPEGREFRSPNTMPDGPGKTIWGEEQKDWLARTIQESDAEWKVIISATPIVGPDRSGKADNHANSNFTYEGDEVRSWIQENGEGRLFLACGDRHWQYHSVHPGTGVHEFSCGPASDEHAGGTPGVDDDYHQFHEVTGGFLSVSVKSDATSSRITFRLHDENGGVNYEYSKWLSDTK